MKKIMLGAALLTLICAAAQAEVSAATQAIILAAAPATETPQTEPSKPAPQGANPPVIEAPKTDSNPPPQGANPPVTSTVPKSDTSTQTPATQAAQPTPPNPALINCEYKIPAEVKTVDPLLVTTWTEKAIVQAFDFDPTLVDSQMQKLQACFTEQGWQGFNTAIQKSGNLEAIKSQKLTVSSQIDGQTQLTETKDNQWKLSLPLQVVYQNDKEKVTQLLHIDVTVSRKINGDLGIIQMIATPRIADTNKTPAADVKGVAPAAQPSTTTPDANAPASSNPSAPKETTPQPLPPASKTPQ